MHMSHLHLLTYIHTILKTALSQRQRSKDNAVCACSCDAAHIRTAAAHTPHRPSTCLCISHPTPSITSSLYPPPSPSLPPPKPHYPVPYKPSSPTCPSRLTTYPPAQRTCCLKPRLPYPISRITPKNKPAHARQAGSSLPVVLTS